MTLKEFKMNLQKLLMQFGELACEGGFVLAWEGEEDIKVGDKVEVRDADGNVLENPDGAYVADGKNITIVGGVVESIEDVEKPAEPAAEEEKPAEEEIAAEEEVPAEEEAPAADDKDAKIAELEAKVAELEAAIAEKDAKIKELEDKVAELEKKPAAPAVEEEFSKHFEIEKTGNKTIDKLIKFASAK